MADSVWVFDVDGCLIDSFSGTSLRPGAAELLGHLRAAGIRLLLWSAGGDSYAHRRASQHGIAPLFDGFFGKGTRDEGGYYQTDHLPLEGSNTIFVDDQPAELRPGCCVIAVRPYLAHNAFDTGLRHMLGRAGTA